MSTAVFWDDLKNGFQTVELGKLGFILLWGTMFVGGGIAMFCIGLVAARRSVDIEIDATQLRVKRRGVFAEKSLLWARDGIERVRIVDSGTQVNSRRLYQLRIYPHRDSHFSMMTGHDQADLAFVVTTIREALGMEEQAEVSAA